MTALLLVVFVVVVVGKEVVAEMGGKTFSKNTLALFGILPGGE